MMNTFLIAVTIHKCTYNYKEEKCKVILFSRYDTFCMVITMQGTYIPSGVYMFIGCL